MSYDSHAIRIVNWNMKWVLFHMLMTILAMVYLIIFISMVM